MCGGVWKEGADEEGRGLWGGFGQEEGSWLLEGQRAGARMVEDAALGPQLTGRVWGHL